MGASSHQQTWENKQVWIIGASTGIGYALAQELAERKATLLLSARSKDKLLELKNSLNGTHHILPLDISDPKAVKNAVDEAQKNLKPIDHIINLAALYEPGLVRAMDLKKARKLVDVNLMGSLYLVHAAIPVLKAQGNGQLALCGSIAGFRGLPNGQPYSATKAAVINLAETLKLENPELDIRIINPGFVRTPLTDKNSFKMPMIIEPEEAAKEIADGLLGSGFEVHFPKKFTFWLKLFRILPHALYFRVIRKKLLKEK